MNSDDKLEKRVNETPSERQCYAAPKLRRFGAVGTLTQSGSPGPGEPFGEGMFA